MHSAASFSGIPSQAASAADQNAAYVAKLRALAAEISLAIEAIAANQPAELLESARRQEILSAELAAFCEALGAGRASGFALTPARVAEMRNAERSLRDALDCYAVLVQRSGRSLAMLARLHSSYAASYPGIAQPNRTPRTWSCEG